MSQTKVCTEFNKMSASNIIENNPTFFGELTHRMVELGYSELMMEAMFTIWRLQGNVWKACYAKMASLAEMLGVKYNTMRKWIRRAILDGLLAKTMVPGKGTGYQTPGLFDSPETPESEPKSEPESADPDPVEAAPEPAPCRPHADPMPTPCRVSANPLLQTKKDPTPPENKDRKRSSGGGGKPVMSLTVLGKQIAEGLMRRGVADSSLTWKKLSDAFCRFGNEFLDDLRSAVKNGQFVSNEWVRGVCLKLEREIWDRNPSLHSQMESGPLFTKWFTNFAPTIIEHLNRGAVRQ